MPNYQASCVHQMYIRLAIFVTNIKQVLLIDNTHVKYYWFMCFILNTTAYFKNKTSTMLNLKMFK